MGLESRPSRDSIDVEASHSSRRFAWGSFAHDRRTCRCGSHAHSHSKGQASVQPPETLAVRRILPGEAAAVGSTSNAVWGTRRLVFWKHMRVEVPSKLWPSPIPPQISKLQGPQKLNVLECILAIALRTRPPVTFGFHLADTWAWLRYLPAMEPGMGLRLRREWDDLDPHQKTVLSDDWGMGFGTQIIESALGVVAWGDCRHVAKLYPAAIQLASGGKRGPKKAPDFLGVDGNRELVILECKGSQSGREAVLAQLQNGISQKKAMKVAPRIKVAASLAVGLSIPQCRSNERAAFIIADPPVEASRGEGAEPDLLTAAIVQAELASLVPLLSLQRFGNALVHTEVSASAPCNEEVRTELAQAMERAEKNASDRIGSGIDMPFPTGALSEVESEGAGGVLVRARRSVPVAVFEPFLDSKRSIAESCLGLARRSTARAGATMVPASDSKSGSEPVELSKRSVRGTYETTLGARIDVEFL